MEETPQPLDMGPKRVDLAATPKLEVAEAKLKY